MSSYKGLDRTNPERVPGDLLKEWTRELEAVTAKVRKELTCPNCGGLMVYGEPCSATPKPEPDE